MSPTTGVPPPPARMEGAGWKPGVMPETAAGRGRPRPRSPGEAWPPAGVSGGADLRGRQRPGGGPAPALLRAGGESGPYLSPGTGCGGGAAGEGLERGLPAGSPPGRSARTKGRQARRADSVPGAGQAERAGLGGSGRRRPIRPSRRYAPRAAAETAGTGPREEPQPERQAEAAQRGRGHGGGDPLTRKQLWPQRRARRDEGAPSWARCRGLSRGELHVARDARLLPPGSCRREPLGLRRRERCGARPPVGRRPGAA